MSSPEIKKDSATITINQMTSNFDITNEGILDYAIEKLQQYKEDLAKKPGPNQLTLDANSGENA